MSKEELLRSFEYDAESGLLYWKSRPEEDFQLRKEWKRWNSVRVGKVAGSRLKTSRGSDSKIQVRYAGKTRGAHRIIWIIVHGSIPDDVFIDHINGDPFDNRLCNLRLSGHNTNQYNRRAPVVNTSGFKGVTWSKALSKWKATIRAGAKYYHLGYYDTKAEAALAVAKGSIRYHGLHSVYLRRLQLAA